MNVLNYLAAAALSLAFIAPSQVDAQAFEQGNMGLNLGVGVGGYSYGYGGIAGVRPGFNASFDVGVKDIGPGTLGIGAYFGYKSSRNTSRYLTNYAYDVRYTNMAIGLRGNYHWNEWHGVDNLDVYAGMMLGYDIATYKDNTVYNGTIYGSSFSAANRVAYAGYVGGRYLFTDIFGAYAELGFGFTVLNVGLTLVF